MASRLYLALLSLPLAALPACDATPTEAAPPPSVVLVVLDTLRPDHLGCYGYERDTSPHLDQLAEESIVFENAQSAAPWTAPSLASLLTSLYPDVHGVKDFPRPRRIHRNAATLAENLSARGYTTAAFTEGGYAKATFGLGRGFDIFPAHAGDSVGYTSNMNAPSRLEANLGLADKWLAKRGERPFFLLFHTYEVHSPLCPPVKDLEFFRPTHNDEKYRARVCQTIEAWNNKRELDRQGARLMRLDAFYHAYEDCPPIADREGLIERSDEFGEYLTKEWAVQSPEVVQWVNDLYDAELRYMDAQLSRLWESLKSKGLWENTVVVLVSDHGESLGDNNAMGHGSNLHESLLRALLMVRLPGPTAPRGKRVDSVVRLIDVMPTLLELTGTDLPENPLQGTSLMPLINGAADERIAFGHSAHPSNAEAGQSPYSIRRGPWHLIEAVDGSTARLYHVPSDPQEETDLARSEPAMARELLGILAAQKRQDLTLRKQLGAVGKETEIDSGTLEELRHLGYMGDE